MTTSRYTAHTDYNNPSRIVVVDSLGQNHAVVEFTPEQDDALVNHMQAFLDAGIARYGSIDAFEQACRWYNEIKAA